MQVSAMHAPAAAPRARRPKPVCAGRRSSPWCSGVGRRRSVRCAVLLDAMIAARVDIVVSTDRGQGIRKTTSAPTGTGRGGGRDGLRPVAAGGWAVYTPRESAIVPARPGSGPGPAVVRRNSGMPVYEYICEDCAHEFEEFSKRVGGGAACPSCGSDTVRRRLSVFAARQGDSRPDTGPSAGGPAGGCGRCGDPYGPCAM